MAWIDKLRRRRIVIPTAVLAGLILLYAAGGFLLAPYLVERYVPELAATKLDRTASVERVRINPFTFTFEVEGFALAERGGQPILRVGGLYGNFDPTARLRGPWTLESLRIVEPAVHLDIDENGTLNLAQIAGRMVPQQAPAEGVAGSAAAVLVREIALQRGTVSLTDRRPSEPAYARLEAVRIEARELTTVPGREGNYRIEAKLPEGGSLELTGSLALAPVESGGRVRLAELPAATVWRFVRDAVRLDEPAGTLSLELNYALRAADGVLELSGEGIAARAAGLELRQRGTGTELLALSEAKLSGGSFELSRREARIESLALGKGRVALARGADGALDWQQLVVAGGKPAEPARAAQTPWKVAVDAVSLSGIDIAYRDATRRDALGIDARGLDASLAARTHGAGAGQALRVDAINAKLGSLRVSGGDAAEPLLALDSIALKGGRFDTAGPALTASALAVQGGSARVRRSPEGEINLLRAFSPLSPAASPTAEDGRALRLSVASTKLAGFDVVIVDDGGKAPLRYTLAGLEASVEGLDTRAEAPMRFAAAAGVEPAGRVDLKGTVSAGRDRVEGEVEISGFALEPIARRAAAETGRALAAETFSAAGKFTLQRTAGTPEIRYQGNARLAGPALDVPRGGQRGPLAVQARAVTVGGTLTVSAGERLRVRYDGKAAVQEISARQPGSDAGAMEFKLAELSVEGLVAADSTGKVRYDGRARATSPELHGGTPAAADAAGAPITLRAASVTAEGEFNRDTDAAGRMSYAGNAVISGIGATHSAGPGAETLALDIATASAEGAVTIEPGGAVSYAGRAAVAEAELRSSEVGDPLVAWKRFAADDLRLGLQPNRVSVKETTLEAPRARVVVLEDRSLDLANRLSRIGGRDLTEKKEPAASEPFLVEFERLQVTDGVVHFSDRSLVLPFSTVVSELSGSVSGFSSENDRRANVALDGRAADHGHARASGSVDLVDPAEFTDLKVTFRNVPMPELSPYVATFAGRKIASGSLALDLNYAIRDGRLTGDNDIVLDQFELGDRVESPSAANLPLDLAVALLKDSDGKIRADVPVRGDVNKPDFDLGEVIGKAIGNLIGGIVTAPFRVLGALFGATPDEKLDRIVFEPGSARLLPPAEEKLAKLAQTLKQRPQLKLVAQGRYDATVDQKALRESAVRRAVAQRLGEPAAPGETPPPINLGGAKTQQALKALLAERAGPEAVKALSAEFAQPESRAPAPHGKGSGGENAVKPADTEALYRAIAERLAKLQPLPEQALLRLAEGRGRAIVDYLKTEGGLAAERLTTRAPAPAEEAAGEDGIAAKLDLEASGASGATQTADYSG